MGWCTQFAPPHHPHRHFNKTQDTDSCVKGEKMSVSSVKMHSLLKDKLPKRFDVYVHLKQLEVRVCVGDVHALCVCQLRCFVDY